MGVKRKQVLDVVSGWESVELILKCVFVGLWQMIQLSVRRLWKGHRRKLSKNSPPVELTVDSSIGIHCYIKIMGVKYHYVETGPKNGQIVLILGDAPDNGDLWVPSWSSVVRRLAELGHHVITLDLRGNGASEPGDRIDLSPPRAVEELKSLLIALGVSESDPAVVIGFGIGGMLTWYLVHCEGSLVSKFAVIAAPHPNLYWQHPPAAFCHRSLHFIQWPYFPEKWLAEGAMQEGSQWASSRARDWSGALNYVRSAARQKGFYCEPVIRDMSGVSQARRGTASRASTGWRRAGCWRARATARRSSWRARSSARTPRCACWPTPAPGTRTCPL
ncbi:epoxide hydrolase 4-like isoform X2 [Vanessa atalanta]|uniref:epoxide hydrolase 4-like isoform X2 n=1 Tax=Vanessa atalanta TaxID=42275 RepID=UPI001FCD293C|nr:epoxide hydrolase 4-like isoform X2 [Vanessa atalanta]